MRKTVWEKIVDAIVVLSFIGMAVGTIWTAYESHIANLGVAHWASEFDQIRSQVPDGPEDNHTAPESTPEEPPRHNL